MAGANGNSPYVYIIGGTVRSGSTLLASLLTRECGAFDCGELHLLWRSFSDGRLCTCGELMEKCSVWVEVRDRVLHEVGLSRPSDADTLQDSVGRQRRLFSPRPAAISAEALELRRATEQAVSAVTGRSVLVDSSKLPTHVMTALGANSRARAIHLIRDPRAVAYSLSRPHSDPSLGGKWMPSMGPVRAAIMWTAINLGMRRISAHWGGRIRVVVYEDLAAEPERTISEIVSMEDVVGSGVRSCPLSSHAIAGNPSRFEGLRPVKRDDRWIEGMSRGARSIVRLITWPLSRQYGYRG